MNPAMTRSIVSHRFWQSNTFLEQYRCSLCVNSYNAPPGRSSDASAPQASHSQAADDDEEEGTATKSKQAKGEQQPDSGNGDKYWDEEDELEEYVMRRDLGQVKDDDADDSASDSDGMTCNLYYTLGFSALTIPMFHLSNGSSGASRAPLLSKPITRVSSTQHALA